MKAPLILLAIAASGSCTAPSFSTKAEYYRYKIAVNQSRARYHSFTRYQHNAALYCDSLMQILKTTIITTTKPTTCNRRQRTQSTSKFLKSFYPGATGETDWWQK